MRARHLALAAFAVSVVGAACGTADAGNPSADATDGGDPGVRVVSVDEAAELHADDERIVIDVRTPEEFDAGQLARARNVDIQGAGFADTIGALDPDASYLVYCRSANRSAGARQLMTELGFRDVADIAGGTIAWTEAGLPLDR